MNLSKIPVFTLLVFIFWSFSGFAQSGELKKEKTKIPEFKNPVKQEAKAEAEAKAKAKTENTEDKKTDKDKKEADKKASESKTGEKKTTGTKEAKTESTQDKKTDKDKKEAPSKTDQSTSTPSNNSSSSPSKSNNEKVETLEITGSYIRRSDVEGPSPIVVIDRQMIERSGFNSIGAVLSRHTTISPFGSGGLKGLGSARTLILINGQRAPGHGSLYGPSGLTSVNIIPVAAVEKIEILKDGASATYGADALGGVINIITRKDLDGFSVTAKTDVTEYKGGDRLRTSVAYGDSSSKGNFITSLQYMHGTKLRTSDIKRLEFVSDEFFWSSNYVNSGSRGSVKPGPNCTRYNSEGLCEDHITKERVSLPSHGLDWVTNGEYEIGDIFFSNDTKIYSTLYMGYGVSESRFTQSLFFTPPQDGRAGAVGIFVPSAPSEMAQNVGEGAINIYGRIKELPNIMSKDENITTGLIVGLKGYLGSSNWVWDMSVNNQFDYKYSQNGNWALYEPVRQALISGTYNPFGSTRNTQGFAYTAKDRNRSQVNWFEAKANGELGSFFGFDWAAALGTSVAHFEYNEKADPRVINQEVMGLSGSSSNGQRQLYAVFAELSGLYKNIEVQLALRGDMYSDFGSTINPKLAVMYQPLNWMTLRTSFGTGFQAPTLQNVYGPQLQAFTQLTDQKHCNEGKKCEGNTYSITQGSNRNLKEEISRSFNVGVVFEPLRNLDFSFDYWNVIVDDTIGSDYQGALQVEALDPSAPERYGVVITRNENTDKIEHIKAPLQNLGKEEAHGLDFQGSFEMMDPIFKGSLSLNSSVSYMFHYYESFYQELGREQVLDQYGKPRWRNVSTLSYRLNSWDGQIISRTFPKMEKEARKKGHIPGHTQFDITLGYMSPWGGRFQLGAINAFNSPPVYDYTKRSRLNSTLYSGERTWFMAYYQDF